MNNFDSLKTAILKDTKLISPEKLNEDLDKGKELILLDVREPEETEVSYIKNAVLIPRGMLEMKVERLFPEKSSDIVVYCASGVRSAFACRSLTELGYENVTSLDGGINAWIASKFPVCNPTPLTDKERVRYKRHLLLDEIGVRGQQRLLESSVLIVGAGGLASPALLYLAAAGVGRIGIVDEDVVDLTNLQRQIIHTESSVDQLKTTSAEARIKSLNSATEVVTYETSIGERNSDKILSDGWDVVIDATDSIQAKYLLNDKCIEKSITYIWASVSRFEGQLMVVSPQGPCYRCLYPTKPDKSTLGSCNEQGVLGALPGILGTIQAAEAIKVITGVGSVGGKLIYIDLKEETFRSIEVCKDPACHLHK